MKPLWIFGGSSYAEIAVHYFNRDTDFEVVGLILDHGFAPSERLADFEVLYLGDEGSPVLPKGEHFHVAVTYAEMNRLRRRKIQQLSALGMVPASYVSPHSYVDDTVVMGEHLFIFEDNTIQPYVIVRGGTILWSGNHLGHHSTIGEDVFVSSHVVISGHCEIGDRTFLGVNSAIANNVSVGEDNWVLPNTFISHDTGSDEFWKPSRAEKSTATATERFL